MGPDVAQNHGLSGTFPIAAAVARRIAGSTVPTEVSTWRAREPGGLQRAALMLDPGLKMMEPLGGTKACSGGGISKTLSSKEAGDSGACNDGEGIL